MFLGKYQNLPEGSSYVFIAFLVAVIAVVVSYQMWMTSSTMPAAVNEGFGGPAHIAGAPDCIQNSDDAALLYSIFSLKFSTTEEGDEDLREFGILLGKLACLKRDLMSPGHLVSATRGQVFLTTQDLEPIAETAARCFAHTIPVRDLAIATDKWNERGSMLLKRLCTSYSSSSAEVEKAKGLFKNFMNDVKDIMKNVCLKEADSSIAGVATPRMVDGREPGENMYLGTYKGYY